MGEKGGKKRRERERREVERGEREGMGERGKGSWGREGESEEGRKRMRNRGREGKCGHLYIYCYFLSQVR